MEETVKAYMAGIVDGEGSISISRQSNSKSYICQLAIVNTNRELIEWVCDNFGGSSTILEWFLTDFRID